MVAMVLHAHVTEICYFYDFFMDVFAICTLVFSSEIFSSFNVLKQIDAFFEIRPVVLGVGNVKFLWKFVF